MNRLRYLTLCSLILFHFAGNGQDNIHEEVFLQISSDRFVSGERILFHALVRSKSSGKLSELSSILYVELLDDQKIPVFQTKIKLEKGQGTGDFFISSLIESGNYQLIGYTRWMKNFGDYYRIPITIYNPFEEYMVTPPVAPIMKYYPESGNLVAGFKNKVLLRYANGIEKGIDFKGRIVDSEGTTLSSIESKDGMAKFYFTPLANMQYRLIYEDSSRNFNFIDLPMACQACASISLTEFSQRFVLKVNDNMRHEKIGMLKIRDRYKIYFEDYVEVGQSLNMDKKSMPEGLLRIEYFDAQGEMKAHRLFYNGPIGVIKSEIIKAKSRNFVELADLNKSITSVSIVVRSYESASRSAVISQINSQLVTRPLRSDFVSQTNLDDWMILSKVSWPEWGPIDQVAMMPEHRNDLIEGIITSSEEDVFEKIVVFSIPGKSYGIHLAQTDVNGKFLLNIEQDMAGDNNGYINVLDYDGGEYEIIMNSEFYTEYPNFENWPIRYDSLTVTQVIKSSVGIQIENSFQHLRRDSIVMEKKEHFEILNVKNYHLDDFTRFPTMRDSFIEYIPGIAIGKSRTDYDFSIRWPSELSSFKQTGIYLVLFDGILASPKEVLEYSPYNISDIEVLSERYYIGSAVLDGIIALKTKEGDLYGFEPKGLKYKYKGLQRQKIYFFPDHTQSKELRIPDQRRLLDWQFMSQIDSSQKTGFYTSDVLGTYEVLITGISPSGELIQEIRTLVVE